MSLKSVAPLTLLATELDEKQRLTLESQVLLEEALATAKIEGEMLDRESVRSSIARQLGIGITQQASSKSAQAFVTVLLEAVRTATQTLTEKQLFQWHQRMFIDKPILYDMTIGDYRDETMQVLSGRHGRQIVHFQAACVSHACVSAEMHAFLSWLNTKHQISVYIKAAIAKFWFVSIHPFEDGNGRLSRMIAERTLVCSESGGLRLYSISQQIDQHKSDYYALLEQCQKGSMDITPWIIWFLEQIALAAQSSMTKLYKIRIAVLFWDRYRDVVFNPRQIKLIKRLLETEDFADGIARKKYKNLVKT
ncbi:Fic family protein, partial [Candidatus Venteria ishoeyi]|uniref:Fic family protein n=1 Tax=Candidatus Venteria ishoeyi TaxID=1899563 RepID=UPI000CDF02DB